MSTQQIKLVDTVEVVQNGCVQVRTRVMTIKDGKEISGVFHRHVVCPGDDYSQEDEKVKNVCAVAHTPEVIEAYRLMAQNPFGAHHA